MVCGGFTCSKNALAALNVLYILVAFILIGVAAYGRAVAIVTSIALIGGIIACGVFLLLVATIGLIGAIKHHQVLLFFYMIILFLLFLIQFAIACACLALNKSQQKQIAEKGWRSASPSLRKEVQNAFGCCGFKRDSDEPDMGHPSCHELPCCKGMGHRACCSTNTTMLTNKTDACPCISCGQLVESHMNQALKISGGIGLFFSFTEIFGVWITVRYRNQKDPRANPSAFL